MDAEELYQMLKKSQEPKGYYFNKERYGYMGCPCRLVSGDKENDRDIICPCVYRTPDVEEYGSCYCNLYVSKEWNEEKIPHAYVPERRPPEKILL
jgi:ferredoxin-thioredoxin reductase catalytic subunit